MPNCSAHVSHTAGCKLIGRYAADWTTESNQRPRNHSARATPESPAAAAANDASDATCGGARDITASRRPCGRSFLMAANFWSAVRYAGGESQSPRWLKHDAAVKNRLGDKSMINCSRWKCQKISGYVTDCKRSVYVWATVVSQAAGDRRLQACFVNSLPPACLGVCIWIMVDVVNWG